MIDKTDKTKWNPYTNRPMWIENWTLAVLMGFGFWGTAYRLAVKWAGN